MSETEPQTEPAVVEESDKSVSTADAPAAAPAAAPNKSDPLSALTTVPAADAATAIFDNIASAVNIMGAPLGIAELTKELKVSMDKIMAAAKTPATLPVVVGAETSRLSMLVVKLQMDNLKMFPNISTTITEIINAIATGDNASLLTKSQSLLKLAPTTTSATATAPVGGDILTSLLTNPLLLAQVKQMNDATDKLNAALAGSEIVKYNENMKKLTVALFPLLAVKQYIIVYL